MADSRRLKPQQGKDTRSVRPAPPPPPKKPNPAILYGGIGGGAILLIVILAVALSGGEPEARHAPKPKKIEMPAAPSAPARTVKPDTGAIGFACPGGGKHEEEEIVISACPCGAQKKFFWDREATAYRCYQCSKLLDNALVKCPKCNRLAVKTHLKPSFN